MRLDIYGQFVVSVITPKGGWSKGRPVAVIEDREACYPIDLLIPNDLTEDQLQRYVTNRFSTFAKPGSEIRRLDVPCCPQSICDANRLQTSQGDLDENGNADCLKPQPLACALVATSDRMGDATHTNLVTDLCNQSPRHCPRIESITYQTLQRLWNLGIVGDDAPVLEQDPTVHASRKVEIVSNGDDRLVALVDQVTQDLKHLLAGNRVERAGRLVRQDNGRVVGERAGHSHPLALAARQLIGTLERVLGKPERG
jgi:hypothetical protein